MAKKPKLPSITCFVNSIDDYDKFSNHPIIQKVVFRHTIDGVKRGIKEKKKEASLFQIAGSDKIITLSRDKWKDTLNNAIQFYTATQNFEQCMECQELINCL